MPRRDGYRVKPLDHDIAAKAQRPALDRVIAFTADEDES
jgi:hypothetical protein